MEGGSQGVESYSPQRRRDAEKKKRMNEKAKSESAEGAEVIGAPRGARLNQLTEMIIGAAIDVHRQTGPGLLESVYEECLCYELSQLGLPSNARSIYRSLTRALSWIADSKWIYWWKTQLFLS